MSPGTIGVIGIGALFVLLFSGIPVGFLLAILGVIGFSYLATFSAGANLIAKDFFSNFSAYSLTVIPMFIFMGQIAFYSGTSRRLYDFAYKMVGQFRGGLAMATTVACAGFAAICGSTNATAATMGTVALPEMKRYHYDPKLATGSVAAGGSLGILIPPSVIFIVYGVMTQESIGKLFVSGILPGILLTGLFIMTIYILCRLNPKLAPAGPQVSWKEKLASLSEIIETIVLFVLVMGGLFTGFFTPTEAGAVGAGGALIIAVVRRNLTWQGLKDSILDTTKLSCMVMVIVTGAAVFGHFLAITRIPFNLATWVGGLPLSPTAIIALIIIIYLIGGCFIDSLALILLTVPIFFPVVTALGFDSIWFGVIIVLVTQIGVISPPLGTNVYIIKGVAGDVPLSTIFNGVTPFLIAMIICTAIIVAFPQVALFLPGLMR
ncbi:MAG TPA: TRAP transporter large permease [Dehalococcoidales bacterium]|nr:TRAP transporter large permease [Dehalococcoidales bacterium]